MDFYSAYAHGFARVAAVTLPVAIADPATNAARILEQARALHDDGVAVAVFPELGLTGYAVDDLFLQDTLLDAVREAILDLTVASADLRPVLVVGAPLAIGSLLFVPVGVKLAYRLPERKLRACFALMLFATVALLAFES